MSERRERPALALQCPELLRISVRRRSARRTNGRRERAEQLDLAAVPDPVIPMTKGLGPRKGPKKATSPAPKTGRPAVK
jgi:hypothetical protein